MFWNDLNLTVETSFSQLRSPVVPPPGPGGGGEPGVRGQTTRPPTRPFFGRGERPDSKNKLASTDLFCW